MSSGIFLSMCNSTMSFFNLSGETTQTDVYKVSRLIFAVIFLSICCYHRRIERIAQKLRAFYQQQAGRIANNASFCLTRSHIGSFFRLTILMVSTYLLAAGLYYSLYDDSKAAVVSFLGVAASDLTRYAFQDHENLAALKVIEYAALFLLGTGLLLLLIPHVRTTAFYSTCLGMIVRKIVLEIREVSTISYFPMDEASEQVKECSKSSDVQRDGLDSYSEASTPNVKSDETRLSTCELSRHSAASSADKEREDVNSCNLTTLCNEFEQDCSVQQVCRFEDTDPVKVEKAVEQYSKSSAWFSVLSKDACAAPSKKLYLLKLCENSDSAVMKIEESSVLNDNMVSIYSNEKEQNIGQDVEFATVCDGSINYNTSPEDIIQKAIAHTLQKFPFTDASIIEENQMIMEKGHSRVNSGEEVSCQKNGSNLNTYENCLLQKLRPFETSDDTKRMKQFGDEKTEDDFTSMTPFEKQFLKQSDEGEDDAIKTEKPLVLDSESVRLHVTETEGIVDKHTEITKASDEPSKDNFSLEWPHQKLPHACEICFHSSISDTDEGDSSEQNNSVAEKNVTIYKNQDGDFVEQACLFENSDEAEKRIYNFDEVTELRDCKSEEYCRFRDRIFSTKHEQIAPFKRRHSKYIFEAKDRATIEAQASLVPPIRVTVTEEDVGEWMQPSDASKDDKRSTITQQSEHASRMQHCSSVSEIDQDSRDDSQELRNYTADKSVSMPFTYDQGILVRKTCSNENEAVPVNNLDSEEMTKRCSDCKTQYHVTSKHECILLPKKRLLGQYSAEETESFKSDLLTKFKSQENTSSEPNEPVPTCNFNSQPDGNLLNFQKDYFAEPRCGKSKMTVSGEFNMTEQSLRSKPIVDNVVNRIDQRFIYSLS